MTDGARSAGVALVATFAVVLLVNTLWPILLQYMFMHELREDWEYLRSRKETCGILRKKLRDTSDGRFEVLIVRSSSKANGIVFRDTGDVVLSWDDLTPVMSNAAFIPRPEPGSNVIFVPENDEMVLVRPSEELDVCAWYHTPSGRTPGELLVLTEKELFEAKKKCVKKFMKYGMVIAIIMAVRMTVRAEHRLRRRSLKIWFDNLRQSSDLN